MDIPGKYLAADLSATDVINMLYKYPKVSLTIFTIVAVCCLWYGIKRFTKKNIESN